MDYKDTLLMPKTDFPMRGNLPNREPDMQKRLGGAGHLPSCSRTDERPPEIRAA